MLINRVIRLDDKTARGCVILDCGCSVRVLDYRQFEFGAEMPCPVHEGECSIPLPTKLN